MRSNITSPSDTPWRDWVKEQLRKLRARQDTDPRTEDVLDTWFSLAAVAVLDAGLAPKQTKDLKTYYQTDVTGHRLRHHLFWVAAMMMMGLHFHRRRSAFPHGLCARAGRDKNGAKMSKVQGQRHSYPLELIDEYGADALRFTLAIMAAQGRDVSSTLPQRVAGYPQFRHPALERRPLRRV